MNTQNQKLSKLLFSFIFFLMLLPNIANMQAPDFSTMGSLPPSQGPSAPLKITPVQGEEINNCVINSNVKGGLTFRYIIMNFFIGCLLTRTAYLLIVCGVLVFLYGVFKYVNSEGDDKQAAREFMFWGIIGVFVLVSFWGLVQILQNTFKF